MKLELDRLPHSVELASEGGEPVFRYIDERLLPGELKLVDTRNWREVVAAIKCLAVRGAPAIGLAGASALALWATYDYVEGGLSEVAEEIACARPTAVNLRWALNRLLTVAEGHDDDVPISAGGRGGAPLNAGCERTGLDDAGLSDQVAGQAGSAGVGASEHPLSGEALSTRLVQLVKQMELEDEAACRAIGSAGAALLPPGARVLTHCNAGSLATSFYGTALGVIYAAAEQGKVERVYANETRPVGQGARLTAWELARVGVPVTLICDNMAASLMASGQVDAVVVGADRIARNGDTANKIGTYGVAVLAHEHGIPLYVAAPLSTIDPALADGRLIPIEQRDSAEVLAQPIPGVDVWNPAFDVTPARYITAIVTEAGVFEPNSLPL